MGHYMEAVQRQIRSKAAALFDEGTIDLFIGFESGTIPLRSRPCFIDAAEASNAGPVDRLVWNSFCSNNLAAYLQRYYENEPNRRKKRETPYKRVGIAVKGCDCRSVVALVKERQVVRDSVVLVGVPCAGMIDRRRVIGLVDDEVSGSTEKPDGTLEVVTAGGRTHTFDREEVLQQACIECRYPAPEGVDILLDAEARRPGDGGYARIEAFEAKSSAERWEYFQTELSKCIRCNACRQACPTCWCKECFADHTDLKWIGMGNEQTDAMIFQIIRIYHQAGRCVECDACYNACPMGVDLRTYTKKIVRDVEDLFGYLPDFDADSVPPLSTFSEQDSDSFITDPEHKTHG